MGGGGQQQQPAAAATPTATATATAVAAAELLQGWPLIIEVAATIIWSQRATTTAAAAAATAAVATAAAATAAATAAAATEAETCPIGAPPSLLRTPSLLPLFFAFRQLHFFKMASGSTLIIKKPSKSSNSDKQAQKVTQSRTFLF